MILVVLLLAGCTSVEPVSSFPEETAAGPQGVTGVEDPGVPEDDSSVILICVRKRTRVRVAYRPCDDAERGFAWYFLPWKGKVPATGGKARGGTFEDPGYDMTSPARRRGGAGPDAALSDVDRFEVCVKERTRIRVPDRRCDDEDDSVTWYYVPYDDHVPAVGGKAAGGSFYRAGSDRFRARTKGGTGSKAVAAEPDEPDSPDEPDGADESDSPDESDGMDESGSLDDSDSLDESDGMTGGCTHTVNGRCRSTGGFSGHTRRRR